MNEHHTSQEYTPRKSPLTFEQYAILIFITTPIAAYVLAYYGYIPFDPLYATIAAFAVSIIYVGYRWYYAKRYHKQES